jgi:hypothetical protein
MPFGMKTWLSQKLAHAEPVRRLGPTAPVRRATPYRGIGVKPGQPCCVEAKQLRGLRFLSASAPKLPLPGCQAAECHCRYLHFADRRSGDDRRGMGTANNRPPTGSERRRLRQGRRETD